MKKVLGFFKKYFLWVIAVIVLVVLVKKGKVPNPLTLIGVASVDKDKDGNSFTLDKSNYYAPYGYMVKMNGTDTGGRAISVGIQNGFAVITNGQGVSYRWDKSEWKQI